MAAEPHVTTARVIDFAESSLADYIRGRDHLIAVTLRRTRPRRRLYADPVPADQLTPRLYQAHTHTYDLTTHPGLIHPPAWMCHPCQDSWGKWATYNYVPPIVLISIGTPIPTEVKRRKVIASQREVIAGICHRHHTRWRRAGATSR